MQLCSVVVVVSPKIFFFFFCWKYNHIKRKQNIYFSALRRRIYCPCESVRCWGAGQQLIIAPFFCDDVQQELFSVPASTGRSKLCGLHSATRRPSRLSEAFNLQRGLANHLATLISAWTLKVRVPTPLHPPSGKQVKTLLTFKKG